MAPTAATRWRATPRTISAYEVIRAIEGPLFITSCVTVPANATRATAATMREPLRKVNQSIEEVLKRIKISQMTKSRRRQP